MPKKSEIYGTFIKGRSIGSGGMTEVFEGIDKTDSSNKCAIKLIKYECSCMDNSCKKCIGFRERFHREQIALKKLDHPNIVKVLGVSEENEKKPTPTPGSTGAASRNTTRTGKLPPKSALFIAG